MSLLILGSALPTAAQSGTRLGSFGRVQAPRTWIVDGNGGGDFREVQPAVDAARSGDSILVLETGELNPFDPYESFTIDGKALFVQGNRAGSTFVDQIHVRNVPAGATVTLRNLTAASGTLEDSAGTIWIEESGFLGPRLIDGLEVVACDNVVLVRSWFNGGVQFVFGSSPGGAGLHASSSTIHARECRFLGGEGQGAQGTTQPSSIGGNGVTLVDSTLRASESTIVGGRGGGGFFDLSSSSCVSPSAGGDGIAVDAFSEATLLGCLLQAGPGGEPDPRNCPTPGPDGLRINGAATEIPAAVRRLTTRARRVEGKPSKVVVTGQPGDLVVNLFSTAPNGLWLPASFGSQLVGTPLVLVTEGTIPSTGQLESDLDPHMLLGLAPSLFVQSLHFDDLGGAYLSSASARLVPGIEPPKLASRRVLHSRRVDSVHGGFTTLDRNGSSLVLSGKQYNASFDSFGDALSAIGDLDGDGLSELAVGAPQTGDGGFERGAVWILFPYPDGTVRAHQKIGSTDGGFSGTLTDDDHFGQALAELGDLDGDGTPDLAVGSNNALWTLFLNANGTVRSHVLTQTGADDYGRAVANIGDFDGNGVVDLAVGAPEFDGSGPNHGAIYLTYLNADGTLASEQEVSEFSGGFGGNLLGQERFGSSVALLDDIDSNGTPDLAVGAIGRGFDNIGGVWILRMNANGTVLGESLLDENGNFGTDRMDVFGTAVTSGDFDGDGDVELMTTAPGYNSKGLNRIGEGSLFIIEVTSNGDLASFERLNGLEATGEFVYGDFFGGSLANLGDVDGNGTDDILVGARWDLPSEEMMKGSFWRIELSAR